MDTIITYNVLSTLAMVAAAHGSQLFVETDKKPADYPLGSMYFLVGNSTNIAIGLSIGDLSLTLAQLGLAWFTLPMYSNKKFSVLCSAWFVTLVIYLGVSSKFHFTADYIGIAASAMAVYGAWAMSKAKWNIMNWMWVLADVLFIYIAILNRLVGLGLVAAIFVWHGYLRIRGYKRTGLFTYTK